MALTILTAPGNNSSVNSEMLFVIQEAKASDPVTYPNYKYVLDIYVAGDLVARLRSTPDPTNYLGVFDVSVILRDYVPAYGLKANYSNATETYDIDVAYTCKLGEEYSDTLYTNLVTDTERTAFKTYATRPFSDSAVIDDVDGKVASNMPRTTYNYKESKWQLLPFYDNVSGIADYSYQPFDQFGTAVQNAASISTAGYIAHNIIQANIGFQKLFGGLTTAQKEAIAYMIIFSPEGGAGEYRVNYQCTRFTPMTLAWLNPYGAYDSYTFGLVNKKTNKVTKKDFAQLNYRINASGVVSYDADGVYYGSKRAFASDVMVTLKLTSHLLNDQEYTWLADLFNSPDIYLYDSVRDRFHPVTITETDYDYRTYRNSRLKPLEFNVQFSDTYNAQYL